MSTVGPPKFKPFKKTAVVLSIEVTPKPAADLTATVASAFRDSTGLGPDSKIKGAAAEEVVAVSEPQMFAKKKPGEAAGKAAQPKAREPKATQPKAAQPKKTPAAVVPGTPAALAAFPGLMKGVPKPAAKPPGAAAVYSREDVLSRSKQATEIEKLPDALKDIAAGLLKVETEIPYEIEPAPDAFFPLSRRGFGSFLVNKYGPIFPKAADRDLDVAKCAAKGEEGVKEVKIYHYQAFIREYLRFETPYRGLLVYHGLGSGKTCSAIAAAEALFGTRGLKIIVMTPFSLRDNFISEIGFCGFKHFRLQNHWTSLSLKAGSNPEPGMVKLFAQNVYGVPESFFSKRARGRPELARIWIPDFEKENNFDKLSPEEKDEIQTQLKATIENRIKFINYNGITARELKTMVCSTPDVFDNSVIVVDEVHNLTRLIQGSLEPYFSNPPGRRRTLPLETLSPERKKLPLCGMTKNYMRGYLFYRLFMDAKNTKVIGLSGTPLINFPEELGILMNILHGPIHTIDFMVAVEGGRDIEPIIKKIIDLNEDLDTVFFQASEGSLNVTVTRLPEHFTKLFTDDSELIGINRRDPGKLPPTLEQVWEGLEASLKAEKLQIRKKPDLKALELLPSWDTPFRGAFLQEDGVTLKRTRVLEQRIRGLVSYYRGIQGDVMPKVIKDEIVGIPLTGYSLKIYNKLRNQEIQVEMSKPKAAGSAGDAVWAEIGEIAAMSTPSNYRMSSRQACNFVFPESVSRPRPRNLEEKDAETGKDRDVILDVDVEGAAAGREETDAEKATEAEDKEVALELKADIEAGKAGAVAPVAALMGTKEQAEAYRRAIKASKEKLREMGPTHLQLEGPPDRNLAKYSPKFAAMLKNINGLGGSSLVYSQFLEMEGIGIFGICMEANGFVPIEIVQAGDGKLKFSDRTEKSLLKGPAAKEMRYIEFTGTGSKEQRGAAVNVFNARLDKLPPAMEKILKDGGWEDNYDGSLCRVFCITSAGAEGLSLKCVRGVHIMEPYWNTVRTQQVKGRAVRICSHMDLPKGDQNVEIYTYCTIIPEEAILAQAVDKTLERSDSYSAKDAEALGVPIPKAAVAGADIPGGLFFKVEENPAAEAVEGAEAVVDGPIRFSAKLENEYRGFSSFAPSPLVINGKRYPSLEHYVQAMKYPSEPEWQEAIRVAPTPLKARQLGEQKDHTVRTDWESVRETVMLEALRAKFQQNRGLLQQLKDTGTRPLIEASQGDPFWGEGRTGNGKNRMGKLLEQIREELREFVIPPGGLDAILPAVAVSDLPVEAPPKAALKPAGVKAPAVDEEAKEGESKEDEPTPPPALEPIGPDEPAYVQPPYQPPVLPRADAPGPGPDVRYEVEPDSEEEAELAEERAVAEADERRRAEMFGPAKGGSLQEGGVGEDRTILLTSDQKVLLISLRKEKVIGSLQTLMKSVAVDCQLNYHDNNDGTYRCVSLGDSIGDFAYHPDLTRDIQETESKYGAEKKAEPLKAANPAEAALLSPAAVALAAAPQKPKPKAFLYKGTKYYYKIKLNEAKQPLGYIIFEESDPDLEKPFGYILADPVKKIPKGAILPVPVD
jgi:hypothetical protein